MSYDIFCIKYVSVTHSIQPDGVVSFVQTSYNARENRGVVTLCVVIMNVSRCPIDFEFKFDITTEMQTAGIDTCALCIK